MASEEPLIKSNVGETNDGSNVVYVAPVEPQQNNNLQFCPHCGVQTVPSFQYCQQCGKPQNAQQAQPVIVVQQPQQYVVTDPVPEISNAIDRELEGDDPTCLYISAILSLFIPLIGIIVGLIYFLAKPHKVREGSKKRQAFIVLIICTVVGLFWSVWVWGFIV
eukprot:47729_1